MAADASATIVRRRDYHAAPWRNGGGVTFEIAREPQGEGAFEWRLSLAQVDRAGPFSDFAGYERAISLVSGAGCRLLGLDSEPRELRELGATTLFDGALPVTAELISGPCRDLNLIVRKPGRIVAVDRFALLGHETESLRAGCSGSVFCLEGVVECLHLSSGARVTLDAHDTMLVAGDEAGAWRLLRHASAAARVIVHAWHGPTT